MNRLANSWCAWSANISVNQVVKMIQNWWFEGVAVMVKTVDFVRCADFVKTGRQKLYKPPDDVYCGMTEEPFHVEQL